MGAATSTLIDELHTSAQLPDESGLARKLHVLRKAQELAKTALISRQKLMQNALSAREARSPVKSNVHVFSPFTIESLRTKIKVTRS